jgi:hypothetical protein
MAYWIVNLCPLFVTKTIILGNYEEATWVTFVPDIFILVPAFLIVLTQRCQACAAVIYTTENMKKVPGAFRRFPLYRFTHCPNCHAEL